MPRPLRPNTSLEVYSAPLSTPYRAHTLMLAHSYGDSYMGAQPIEIKFKTEIRRRSKKDRLALPSHFPVRRALRLDAIASQKEAAAMPTGARGRSGWIDRFQQQQDDDEEDDLCFALDTDLSITTPSEPESSASSSDYSGPLLLSRGRRRYSNISVPTLARPQHHQTGTAHKSDPMFVVQLESALTLLSQRATGDQRRRYPGQDDR